jgi:hypothetical protein
MQFLILFSDCAFCIVFAHSIVSQPVCVCVCVCVADMSSEARLQQEMVCIYPCREIKVEKGSYKMGASDPTTPNQVTCLVLCI